MRSLIGVRPHGWREGRDGLHFEKSLKTIKCLSPKERYELAGAKTDKLVTEILRQMRTTANNDIVVRSPVIAQQIPISYAANAYNHFRVAQLHYELIQVSKLWEPVDLDGFGLQTISALADDNAVFEIVSSTHLDHYPKDYAHASAWAKLSTIRLSQGKRLASKVSSSQSLTRVRNFRDKVAHLLEQSRIEKKGSVIESPLQRDAQVLLRAARITVDRFHLALNGASFDWKESELMCRRHAQALWHGMSITVRE